MENVMDGAVVTRRFTEDGKTISSLLSEYIIEKIKEKVAEDRTYMVKYGREDVSFS